MRSVSKAAFPMAMLILGALIGYAANDLQRFHNTQTLADILVLEKFDDHAFKLQTDKGQAFNATFCDDTHVDFRPGEKLRVLNYEQRTGCKSLVGRNLGFLAYTDEHGKRINFN